LKDFVGGKFSARRKFQEILNKKAQKFGKILKSRIILKVSENYRKFYQIPKILGRSGNIEKK